MHCLTFHTLPTRTETIKLNTELLQKSHIAVITIYFPSCSDCVKRTVMLIAEKIVIYNKKMRIKYHKRDKKKHLKTNSKAIEVEQL